MELSDDSIKRLKMAVMVAGVKVASAELDNGVLPDKEKQAIDDIVQSHLSSISGISGLRSVFSGVLGQEDLASGKGGWCVSISLLRSDDVLVSAISNPSRDHLFFAQKEAGVVLHEGCSNDGRRLFQPDSVVTNSVNVLPYGAVESSGDFNIVSEGCAATALCDVAMGKRVGAVVQGSFNDLGAAITVARESGLRLSVEHKRGNLHVIAAHPRHFDKVKQLSQQSEISRVS